ncbi:MAG: phosphopentomutase [Ancalomicrobiaceae bacterium]|nr:phosphopentomutase [Ancalomicrobiaceae bacterium]
MPRAFLLIMDSFGIGGAADAGDYGDAGSDTLGHIAAACAAGRGDRHGLRAGPLLLPHLDALGLGLAAEASSGALPVGLNRQPAAGAYGFGVEVSKGKDTPSGHWELAGVPVPFDWGYFPVTVPCFPADLIAELVRLAGLPGILGDKHASGTEIIAELGEEHMRTGKPIVYTSADSVIQIAAHEETFGLERLYDICLIARKLVDPLTIGRVIARPFVGTSAADFTRTGNRRDYAVPPPEPTLLDRAKAAGRAVVGIGKISDIYAGSGLTQKVKASGNSALFDATLVAQQETMDGGLVIANFVDFDMNFGHRRDVPGYAAALEAFDARLPEFVGAMRAGDLAIITADHGCDPTWRGTDHTREHVPILAFGPGIAPQALGGRGFADIGETLASHLRLAAGPHGKAMW